ncbi:MAG: ImmA/IrrE family metallo-endopeptidase [Lachnospiraceae bacterium]|nr:ImmA/IrrE family metallo-endopeptidase [Lachnospiraceae bacterium]
MPMVNVNVQPEIIRWALNQTQEEKLGEKLFSLLHEAAHIWIGENDLYNDRNSRADGVSDLERICNAVAGELLVSKGNSFTMKVKIAAPSKKGV